MKEQEYKIVISGGKTGGHVYPALAIANEFKKRGNVKILFIGTQDGLESRVIPKNGYDIAYVKAFGLKRKISLDIFKTVYYSISGFVEARKIIQDFDPQLIITTGGYVSLPVAISAKVLKIPLFIHEQNVFPGLTNKLTSRFANKIFVSFEESRKYFKNGNNVVFSGNPIREELLNIPYSKAKELINEPKRKVVLSIGGSGGAKYLNHSILDLAKRFAKRDDVIFIVSTGEKYYNDVLNYARQLGLESNLKIYPYIEDMPIFLNAADVVISRGGAIALSEIMAVGVASIIVPSPYVSNNHQEFNARYLEKNGAAYVVLENQLSGDELFNYVVKLLDDDRQRREMAKNCKKISKTNAVQIIVDTILKSI